MSAQQLADEAARENRLHRHVLEHLPQEALDVVEVLLELDRVVDAVVALAVEILVLQVRPVLEVQHAGALAEPVGHERAGGDDGVYPAAVDHLAEHQPLLGDRHRARDRDDAEAALVADHRLEHVGGLAEAAPAEGRLAHGANQGVHAVGSLRVERRQRRQPVLVAVPVLALVTGVRHRYLRHSRGAATPLC